MITVELNLIDARITMRNIVILINRYEKAKKEREIKPCREAGK